MANSWQKVKLAEIATIIMGQSPPGDTYNEIGEGMPFYQGIADFGARYPTRRVFCSAPTRVAEPSDILLSIRAPIGRLNLAREKCAIGRGLAIIRAIDPEDQTFIKFALHAQGTEWYAMEGGGSVFGNATRGDLESLELVWPKPSIRRFFANILGTLDDKIELNRRMNETLEQMARAIFKSWFVGFDPVRAKAEGRRPAGMTAETAKLFPDSFVDSELGKIPRGWKLGCLGDIAENPRRGVNAEEIEPGTPYIGLEHMPRKSIVLSNWGTAEDMVSNKFRFSSGEILFGKLRPYFHKVGVAVQDGVCSTDILVITPKSQEWFGFAISCVSSIDFINYTDAHSTGTKMPRTNWGDMSKYKVILPPAPLAEAFNDITTLMIKSIRNNILESRTLASIRDALLPKLLSGELRVPDTEKTGGGIV